MKIIRMKKSRENTKADMFAVMCLVQSAAVILAVMCIYFVSATDSGAYAELKNYVALLFADDVDLGGYFTGNGENGAVPLPGVSGEPKETASSGEKLTEDAGYAFVKEDEYKSILLSQEVFGDYSAKAVLPVSGTVTSSYGYREHPVYSGDSFHSGEDIAADEGSPVYAVLDGVVTEAGTAEMAGNYIKLDHGDGVETLYCHCSELYVQKGVRVRKGDVIAAVGQTGLATGPHLHFELHENGNAVDPKRILSEAECVY